MVPDYQNMGIGSSLLKILIETSRKKYLCIRLGVNEKAHRIRSFYKKMGFLAFEKDKFQLTF